MLKKIPIMAAFAAALLLAGCTTAKPEKLSANFSVHKIYGNHMVLQREKPIIISGHAIPGESVKVAIGKNSIFATADKDGEWVAELPAMKAGGPCQVTVTGAANSKPVTFEDVLIGDVWLASGQSNMEMPVYSKGKFWSSLNGKEEAAKANNPNIRLYNATAKKYVSPGKVQHEVVGPGWQLCTPETVAPFSAAAYYFGRELNKDLNVPIGLISASWGGTAIQPWISYEAYQRAGRDRELMKIENLGKNVAELEAKYQVAKAKAKKEFLDWEKRFYSANVQATAAAVTWKSPNLDDFSWTKIDSTVDSFPEGIDGVAWYRRAVEIPANWAGKDLILSLGAIDDCDETFFNGEKVGATGTEVNNYWSVPRKYKIPGKLVKAGRNVIAVRVIDMYADGGIQGTNHELFLSPDGKQKVSLAGDWKFKLEFAADLTKIGNRPEPFNDINVNERHPSFPSTLYNSMIAPWTIYPLRGFLWYQGETNAGAPEDYLTLQQLLISDWRTQWKDSKLPFLFVQLSGYEKHSPNKPLPDDYWVKRQPGNPAWAAFREAQAATLHKVPYTGIAVCIDAGNHSDIHPANKQAVGFRLAKEAERISYGKNIVSAGPMFKSMTIKAGKAIISFTNVGAGLVAKGNKDGKLGCFAIAGEDGKFVWADAIIVGDTVEVSSPHVKTPAAVRYGWVSYAGDLNFYNKDGFPACPFRTDMPDYVK